MDLLPAIDLKDGKVVRLTRGDYQQVTIYSNDPVAKAIEWMDEGAKCLHLVDLDAALEGKPINFPLIKKIAKEVKARSKNFEIGGGVRDEDILKQYIEEAGASRVILGTIAYKDPSFVKKAAKKYPGKIAVGIDVKNGKIATQGWTEVQNLSAADLANRFQNVGVSCIIYTDIARDGMLSGYNIEGVKELAQNTSLPIIIAGGLKDTHDLQRLLDLKSPQIIGAIAGKSIYEGTLNLKEALKLCSQKESSPV